MATDSARVARRHMAGVFQAPPKLTEDITRWARSLYAGHVLDQVNEKLKMARGSDKILDNAIKELEQTRRELPRAVGLLEEEGEVHRWVIYNISRDGNAVPFHEGIKVVGVDFHGAGMFQWGQGERRLTFKKRRRTVSETVITSNAWDSIDRSLRRLRQWSALGGNQTDDTTLVELMLLQKECLKWTAKAKLYKTKAKTVMPVDISGWKYLDVILADLNKRVIDAKTYLTTEIAQKEESYREELEEFEDMTSKAVLEAVETQTLNSEAERIFKKHYYQWSGRIPTTVRSREPKLKDISIRESLRAVLGFGKKKEGFLENILGEGWDVPFVTVEEAKKLRAALVPVTKANVQDYMARYGWDEISVTLFFAPHSTRGGMWTRAKRSLEVDVWPSNPRTVEAFKEGLFKIGRTTRHEVQHVGQDLIKDLTPAKERGGLPGKSIRDPKRDEMGYPVTMTRWSPRMERVRDDHAVQDVEFATRLADEISKFQRLSRKIPINKRREAMHIWTYSSGNKSLKLDKLIIRPADFFSSLKRRQPGKWRRAVGEFVAGVQKAMRMASGNRYINNPTIEDPMTKLNWTPSPSRVADHHLRRAGGYTIASVDAVLKRLERKFRRAKFKYTVQKSGSAIWNHTISVGSKRLVWVKESGWSPNMRYELLVYGDSGYESGNTIRGLDAPPTEREIWAIVSRVITESPVLVAKLRQKGLTAPQVEAVNAGLLNAKSSVRGMIAIPLEVLDHGDVEAGDYWFRLEYRDEATERDVVVFEVVVDVSRKKFTASSFGVKMEFKTIRGVVGLLANADKLVRKGLKTREAGERNMLLGKLTADSVVKRAVSTETDFSRIDEWQDTIVRVTVMLRTSKKVPGKLIIQWVKEHWRDITPLINDKTPAAASSRSRGMGYDEPEAGLGWPTPSRIDPNNAEVSFLGQNGSRATVEVRESNR